ncbi:hypothetical protein [Tsukamurella sp. NPDC003166]|uniref:hypothetical protein n=1 Tax=Tsukamurella sp. NPDC003166 TaxID=3154444 RepID=UPI0033A642F4
MGDVSTSSELFDLINSQPTNALPGRLTDVRPAGDMPEWWGRLGENVRTNAAIAADIWSVSFPEVAEKIRSAAEVALGGIELESSIVPIVLYRFKPEYDIAPPACVGYLPKKPVSGSIGSKVAAEYQTFCTELHNGFAVEIRTTGHQVTKAENLISWAAEIGVDAEDFHEDSSFGFTIPYIPDPSNLMMTFTGEHGIMFSDVESPESPWCFQGDVFFCPEKDSQGQSVTPGLVLQRLLLEELGYSIPLL